MSDTDADMVEVEVQRLLMVSEESEYIVLLSDKLRSSALPISIGPFEAQAIALGLNKQRLARPLTHDLLADVFSAGQLDLQRVEIHTLKDNTFFARLVCTNTAHPRAIDARPSDAIALATRLAVPIYVADSIFTQAGISYEKQTEQHLQEPATLDILQQQLRRAINDEKYEEAARLRDQIRKLPETTELSTFRR